MSFKIELEELRHFAPDIEWHFMNLSLWITREENIKLSLDLCETSPYAPDGEVPLIFFFWGMFSFSIESFWLYKTIYKHKYNETLIKKEN